MGKKISFPIVAIGCGHENGGVTNIVQFRVGPACLANLPALLVYLLLTSNSSRLHFGANAVVSGKGVVSTPIVPKSGETFYYLTLERISVGNQRFNIYDPSIRPNGSQEGNIIIDSGTTLTLLPSYLYNNLEKAIASGIELRRIKDPQGLLNLCYYSLKDIQVPDIMVNFKGADVKLNTLNTFVRTSVNVLCFAFAPVNDTPIYDDLAQVNFLIGYDLNMKTVSFKPIDCNKS
ncbi:Eukaryotic aspartyl protease family protein [Abeliophyllum distichum]|uniref:Eukaryotic aspartyl protease family protein n=1 Tax=Abeliophyllum distichum TaxID=126358 RepID=A0ABD1PBX9_9LAMI